MVTKITVPKSIEKTLNYNEQKVKKTTAECLYAHNFLKEAEHLNLYEKLLRFKQLIALNKRALTNTVHISLNFSEKDNLNSKQLIEIAIVYMERIGFNKQPYLVYRHYDAGHDHLHIITTNIQRDGKRISVHNMGYNQSNKARKEIEIEFGLTKAEKQNANAIEKISPADVKKIIYGRSPIKRALTSVLSFVLQNYKYGSLQELNAVLKLYNVVADKGKPGSLTEKHHGLVYRILDADGKKIGVPIKASSILNKPTLGFLEQKFVVNEGLKQPFKKSVTACIDWVLLSKHQSLVSFQKALEKEKITVLARQSDRGVLYDLTYIDHTSKSVFTGSEMGKAYSVQAVMEKCGLSESTHQTMAEIRGTSREKSLRQPMVRNN